MNAIELIGFFVTIAMIGFYLLKGIRDELERRRNPEEFAKREREREENLRRLMKQMSPEFNEDDEDLEEELRPEPTKALKYELQKRAAARRITAPTPQQQKPQQKPVEPQKFVKEVKAAESYEVIRSLKISRGMKLIRKQQSPRDAFILKELFDKPLSLR